MQDKMMSMRLKEAHTQAEVKEVKLKNLQLESQVHTHLSLVGIFYQTTHTVISLPKG